MSTAISELNEMRIMDVTAGDFKIQWDRSNTQQVDAARAAFDDAKKRGMLFYKAKRDGSRGRQITEFDARAERIIGVPAVRGG